MQSESIVRDPSLAPDGHKKIDWAAEHSPVLNIVRDKYLKDSTFEGLGVGVALPIEAKTAYLTVVLAEAGADVAVASPGPFFVQDDVAAALAERDEVGAGGADPVRHEIALPAPVLAALLAFEPGRVGFRGTFALGVATMPADQVGH